MGRELIDAVEAIYSHLDVETPGQWLARVVPYVSACVGWDQGAYAHAYDLRGPADRWALSLPTTHDLPSEVATTVLRCFELAPPEMNRRLFLTGGPSGTFSTHAGATFDQMPGEEGMSAQTGVRDCAFVNAANPDGEGILFCVTTDQPRTLGAAERKRLAMVARLPDSKTSLLVMDIAGNRPTPVGRIDVPYMLGVRQYGWASNDQLVLWLDIDTTQFADGNQPSALYVATWDLRKGKIVERRQPLRTEGDLTDPYPISSELVRAPWGGAGHALISECSRAGMGGVKQRTRSTDSSGLPSRCLTASVRSWLAFSRCSSRVLLESANCEASRLEGMKWPWRSRMRASIRAGSPRR